MGKVRTSKRKQYALDEPSSSLKLKKPIGEKLTAKQHVKFKAKAANAAGSYGLSKVVPLKGRKADHLKDLVNTALKEDSCERVTVVSSTKQENILSDKTVLRTNTDSGLSPRPKRKKKKKGLNVEVRNIPKGADNTSLKNLAMTTNDVPLAVKMPQVIDESDTTLSDLNTTSNAQTAFTLDMDTSESADSSSAIQSTATDSDFFLQKKSKAADVPLAVVMPGSTSAGSTSRVLATKEAKKETKSPTVDKPVIESTLMDDGDTSECLTDSSLDKEIKELNKSLEKPVDTDSSKRLSERDKVLENVKIHLVGSSVVVQFTHPTKFYIFGQVEVQVLSGKIKILGYEMDRKSGSHLVSSLRGSSFLSIRPEGRTFPKSKLDSTNVDLPPGLQDETALKSLIGGANPNDVWVLLKEGNQHFLQYIQTYLEYPIYPKELKSDDITPLSEAQEALNCVFQPALNLGKRVTELQSWDAVAEKIIKQKKSCNVLCGGKGVGKSTLLRFLVNRLLSKEEGRPRGVVVLDFDPGQAELTPPGCVAASIIKKPLLGPNYTHLQQPERCIYIGGISVTQCLGRYMEAITSIIQYFRESPHLCSLPCIVNTMGFNQGIGVTIMGQVINFLRPTRVIQIESKRGKDNYPFHLKCGAVMAHASSSASRCISESMQLASLDRATVKLSYEFTLLPSAAEVKSGKDENVWGMKPKVSRDAVILSYFSPLVQSPSFSILDDVPFSCPLKSLFLCVAHEQVPPEFFLSAINGNMVALCAIDPTTPDVLVNIDPDMPRVLTKVPIAPCLGFGIVRGVDMHAKMLYLSTPLKEDTLILVNCLTYGVVNLPTTVYIKSTAAGIVPYVSSGQHPDVLVQE